MAYETLDPQPMPRADDDLTAERYDERAPGLYPGELALQLDDGTLVAVSVDQTWLANGEGVNFKATARWIDADGATHLCPREQHVETLSNQNATVDQVAEFGPDALALEALLLALGEPPRLMKEVPEDGGGTSKCPVFDVSETARSSDSIRNAVAIVAATPAQADVGALIQLGATAAPSPAIGG